MVGKSEWSRGLGGERGPNGSPSGITGKEIAEPLVIHIIPCVLHYPTSVLDINIHTETRRFKFLFVKGLDQYNIT